MTADDGNGPTIPPRPRWVLRRTVAQFLRAVRYRNRRRIVNLRHRIRFYRDDIVVASGTHVAKGVVIGRGTRISEPSYLEPCTIGRYVAIGGRLTVRSADHLMQFLNIENDLQVRTIGAPSVLGPRQMVNIGNSVWIGDSVIILSGVQVGDGAVIGAGSVVTRDVPAYSLAAGAPARFIRWRFPEPVIAVLAGFDWWNWDDARLRRNRALFEIDLTTVDPDELAAMLRDAT